MRWFVQRQENTTTCFSFECWKKAMLEGCAAGAVAAPDDEDGEKCRKALLLDIKPEDIVGRGSTTHWIGWNNLTEEQKNYVRETLRV
jgi:hypothetical protein